MIVEFRLCVQWVFCPKYFFKIKRAHHDMTVITMEISDS